MSRTFRTSIASRERNRMHARKTRQRKKEHMQSLQSRADELKEEQLRIRQVINEKNTASILVGLFSTATTAPPSDQNNNPEVEKLLRRPEEEIPDAAKIPELPALILPGQHNSKKKKRSAAAAAVLEVEDKEALPDDGIDYQLLGKERAKCSPAELDQIRRERNRMHAKRTRDRKRMFMDEMEEMIKQLEEENALLQHHLKSFDGSSTPPALVSPKLTPAVAPTNASLLAEQPLRETPTQRKQLVTQLKSLLVAAGAFEASENKETMSSAITAVSTSTDASGNSSCADPDEHRHAKRQRQHEGAIPHSITTTT